jgi:hypothetical protein
LPELRNARHARCCAKLCPGGSAYKPTRRCRFIAPPRLRFWHLLHLATFFIGRTDRLWVLNPCLRRRNGRPPSPLDPTRLLALTALPPTKSPTNRSEHGPTTDQAAASILSSVAVATAAGPSVNGAARSYSRLFIGHPTLADFSRFSTKCSIASPFESKFQISLAPVRRIPLNPASRMKPDATVTRPSVNFHHDSRYHRSAPVRRVPLSSRFRISSECTRIF